MNQPDFTPDIATEFSQLQASLGSYKQLKVSANSKINDTLAVNLSTEAQPSDSQMSEDSPSKPKSAVTSVHSKSKSTKEIAARVDQIQPATSTSEPNGFITTKSLMNEPISNPEIPATDQASLQTMLEEAQQNPSQVDIVVQQLNIESQPGVDDSIFGFDSDHPLLAPDFELDQSLSMIPRIADLESAAYAESNKPLKEATASNAHAGAEQSVLVEELTMKVLPQETKSVMHQEAIEEKTTRSRPRQANKKFARVSLPASLSPESGSFSDSPSGLDLDGTQSMERLSLVEHLQMKQPLGPTPMIDPLDPEGVEGSVVDELDNEDSDSITNPIPLGKDFLRLTVDHLSQKIVLHYDKCHQDTLHFFELTTRPDLEISNRLLTSIARHNNLENYPPGQNMINLLKTVRFLIPFNHCTYQVTNLLKTQYTLMFNSAFEQSLFYFPSVIFDKRLGYIRTFPKTTKKSDFNFSSSILNQRVKKAVDQAVDCRGQVIFTGQSASLLRAASVLTASHLQPSNGIIIILCNYLVTPFWRLVIQKLLKEMSSIQLHCISIKDKKKGKLDSVVQEKFLTESIILVSLTKFEDFTMPRTTNKITLIIDDVLKKPSEADPQDILQMQKAERVIVVDPNYKKMRRRERDLILTGLIRPDLPLNSPFLRMIERLHMIDLDEDSFDPSIKRQYELQIGVYSVRLDPIKAAEMEAIQEVLDKDDRSKCLDTYIKYFGDHSLQSLASKLTEHFEQASEVTPPAVKQSKKFKKQQQTTPRSSNDLDDDDDLDSPTRSDHLNMEAYNMQDDKQIFLDRADEQDDVSALADEMTPANAKLDFVDKLSYLGKRSLSEVLEHRVSPLTTAKNSESKIAPDSKLPSLSKSTQDLEGSESQNDENQAADFTARLSRRKRKRTKQKRSRAMVEQAAKMDPQDRPRKYQVSNMKEYIANHQFECARKGLHFRMLNLNSEGKIEATLKIIQYHIKFSQSKRVIIWCHHQYIQSIAYKSLEKALPGDFSLFCNFTKSKDKRDMTIQKFREAQGKAVIIMSMLSHKELMIGTQWDLMVFAELIHQRHHLEEAVKLGFLQQHFENPADQDKSIQPGMGNYYPNQDVNRVRQIIFVKSGSGINIDTGMWDKIQELMVNLHTPTKPCKGPNAEVEYEGSTLSEWSNPANRTSNADEVMSLVHTNTTFQEEDLQTGRISRAVPDVEVYIEDMGLEEAHRSDLVDVGVESFRLIRQEWLPSYSADSQLFGIPISRTETIRRAKADRNMTPLEAVHSLNWTNKYKALFDAHKQKLMEQEGKSIGDHSYAPKFSDASYSKFNKLMEDSEYQKALENPFGSVTNSGHNSTYNSARKMDVRAPSLASSSSFMTEARYRTRSTAKIPNEQPQPTSELSKIINEQSELERMISGAPPIRKIAPRVPMDMNDRDSEDEEEGEEQQDNRSDTHSLDEESSDYEPAKGKPRSPATRQRTAVQRVETATPKPLVPAAAASKVRLVSQEISEQEDEDSEQSDQPEEDSEDEERQSDLESKRSALSFQIRLPSARTTRAAALAANKKPARTYF